MTWSLDIAQAAGARLGEGPTWDAATQRLLWVDILGSEVHRLDPVTGRDVVLRTPQHVGAAKPRAGGGLVVNLCDGVGLYGPDGELTWLTRWPREGCRGNDAAVDAQGRLWAGTMRYDEAAGGGRLHRVDADGDIVDVLNDVTVSNGIGWSPDGRLMYYVDSPTCRLDVFDVEADTGLVAGRRPFVALDRVVDLPVTHATACAFGSARLTDLYITTARDRLDEATLAGQPHAGDVFVVAGAGEGLPGHAFAALGEGRPTGTGKGAP